MAGAAAFVNAAWVHPTGVAPDTHVMQAQHWHGARAGGKPRFDAMRPWQAEPAGSKAPQGLGFGV